PQIGPGHAFGDSAALLPRSQCAEVEAKAFCKIFLRQTEALTRIANRPRAEELRQLLNGQRLGIGIGARGGFDLFFGHCIDASPVRAAFGLRITSRAVPYKLPFHGGWPSSR